MLRNASRSFVLLRYDQQKLNSQIYANGTSSYSAHHVVRFQRHNLIYIFYPSLQKDFPYKLLHFPVSKGYVYRGLNRTSTKIGVIKTDH